MKNIACFCIPAHGHTNPMLPVIRELVQRGNRVRFYSFDEFEAKISAVGAEFVSVSSFLPTLTAEESERIKQISTTEMTVQDIRITLQMDDFLTREYSEFHPDVVFTDSVCFWGKLSAWKHGIPMVVSTSTFAFNQLSSQYMKNSPRQLADLIFGLPKIAKTLKELKPYGYHVSNPLTLVSSDNDTDSVVYASRLFQPYSESFSEHYLFAGPSVFSTTLPDKAKSRPLVYISMGTVINDRPDFYRNCIAALSDLDLDILISCGSSIHPEQFPSLPKNVQMQPSVDQPEVLAHADVFITHCGMNSVSESLYMSTPMVLFPQTSEQYAVARRAHELGAGLFLKDNTPASIRSAVQAILSNPEYAEAASACSRDFRSAPGSAAAAEFIEAAPHTAPENTLIPRLNARTGLFRTAYWIAAALIMVAFGILVSSRYVWIIGLLAGISYSPVEKKIQPFIYKKLLS